MLKDYDILVVGGGHAGCEAAAAAANMGSSVLLVTMNMETIAQMSCNPAMGGIAKGQIVREVDALGGYSGIVTDRSAIQFKMLNLSKGPAMWSPRAQNDRMRFREIWRTLLEQTENVHFWQDMVTGLKVENNKVVGVTTSMGITINCKAVVLTNGTFLNGLIHLGEKQFGGGRAGERAATGITEQLLSLGFESGRMKTGTPPRVDGRSLDFSKMVEQPGDVNPQRFSYLDTPLLKEQRSCHMTYTNEDVHDILRTGFAKSPMFNGRIQGVGPRYCPSIEDKIERFAERNRHQIFVEPEGWDTVEIYVNGFSTSLPEDVQLKAMRQIEGFENVRMFRPGYAIEYDYFPPLQLQHTLETKLVEHLYFAGQINGTTGYEEAACQGLMAGINAHLKVNKKDPFILGRSQAYIGVLIDDLITKGTEEPYRMFTSRAEYRILLRQDNADLRLTALGHSIGLASEERLKRTEYKRKSTAESIRFLKSEGLPPESINPILEALETPGLNQQVKAEKVLTRPQLALHHLEEAHEPIKTHFEAFGDAASSIREQTEVSIKYAGYIEKEQEMAMKLSQLDDILLKPDFNYSALLSLSAEAVEKLEKVRPKTIGQAARISGVSPSDISVLMIFIGR